MYLDRERSGVEVWFVSPLMVPFEVTHPGRAGHIP
jgi:hypothetical protein